MMKLKYENIEVIGLIFMVISIAMNILFINNIVSDNLKQSGFILVVLWGIVVNFKTLKDRNNNLVKNNIKKKSMLAIIIALVISIGWVITYGATIAVR